MKDPVSPELRAAVFLRDGGCIAPLVGGSVMDCWGRLTIEHVKEHVKDKPRLGKRASSDMAHCVSLCQGHTEDGRRGGFQWNSTRENRARVREYLARFA